MRQLTLLQWIGASIILIGITLMTLLFIKQELVLGMLVGLIPIGLLVLLSAVNQPVIALFLLFVENYFIMGIQRYVPVSGIGVLTDALFAFILMSTLFRAVTNRDIEWKAAVNGASILLFVWFVYCLIELANPTAITAAWASSFRSLTLYPLLTIVLTCLFFRQFKHLKLVIVLWSHFTLIAVFKMQIQKSFGFDQAELQWLQLGENRQTHLLASGTRYFSFFTDAGNYGSNMGCAAVVFSIIGFYTKKKSLKILFFITALVGLYGLFVSGTRGALAVPFAGFVLFTLLSKRTGIMIGLVVFLVFTFIFFNYTTIGQSNSYIRRMRSAFDKNEPSLVVRLDNQKRLAQYINQRPFGEGIGLSGVAAKRFDADRLTTNIPNDSWYESLGGNWYRWAVAIPRNPICHLGAWHLACPFPTERQAAERLFIRTAMRHVRHDGQFVRKRHLGTIPDLHSHGYVSSIHFFITRIRQGSSIQKTNRTMIPTLLIEEIPYWEEIMYWGDYLVFLLFILGVGYTFLFSIASLSKTKQKYPPVKKNYRYCVLIPAVKGMDHNVLESATSFHQQLYPGELFDIVVSTNGMDPYMQQQLESKGVIVLINPEITGEKNTLIDQALQHLNSSSYDALVLMNPNNIVDANYLEEINKAFYSGGMAIQTHRVSKSYSNNLSWLSAIMEEINNSIFRRGHVKLGFSSSLIGSGMVIKYKWFLENANLNPDMDLVKHMEAKLLKQGIYIEYLEDVFTYEDKIKDVQAYNRQRKEWSRSRKVPKRRIFRDFPRALFAGNFDYCDKLFQWMMPSKILMLGFLIIVTAGVTQLDPTLSIKWWALLGVLLFSYIMAIPEKLLTFRTFWALILLPILFISVVFNKLTSRLTR